MSALRMTILGTALAAGAACGSDDKVLQDGIDQLLAESRALVHAEGCARADQCAAAAVGAKACGGPREYWVYCRTTTDEKALLSKLDQEKQLEEEFNRRTNAVSDCLMLVPPGNLALDRGRCVVAPTTP